MGMTAAALGAAGVILTDLDVGLELARRNIALNRLEDVVDVMELPWGTFGDEMEAVMARCRGYGDANGFVLLGSDVFYDKDGSICVYSDRL